MIVGDGMSVTWVLTVSVVLYQVESQVVNLRGKGASFPNEVYKSWIPSYKASRQSQTALNMDYESVGSGAGKKAIMENKDIEYAGSDSPLTESEKAKYPDLIEFPTMAGAIVVGYNIPNINCTLHLTQEQLVGIYNGTYKYWNETSFKESNPYCAVINEKIVVIARADKSGSTSIFTAALSSFDRNWASVYGTFSLGIDSKTQQPVHWNHNAVTYYGRQTRGVSGLMLSFQNSITYLSVADALSTRTDMALLQNNEGVFTSATSESIQNAMEYFASETTNLTFSLANSFGNKSYPIASFTYVFVYKTTMSECSSVKEFVRYVKWFLLDSSPIEDCKALGMVPLSTSLISRIIENVLMQMTCENGQSAWELVKAEDNIKPHTQDKSWVLSVSISVPILSFVVFLLVGCIFYQRCKFRNVINDDEWNIPIEEIIFYYDVRKTSQKSHLHFVDDSFRSLADVGSDHESNILIHKVLQWPGKWNGNNIGLRILEIKQFKTITLEMKKKMFWIRDKVIHQNVVRFYGITDVDKSRYVISDYCAKGALTDILQDDKFNMNNDCKLSLTTDIALGMQFLHSQNIVHGNLRTSTCLIDSKWTVRISDWEYSTLLSKKESESYPLLELRENNTEQLGLHTAVIRDFFVAPEILKKDLKCMPTKESDVFSFAIVTQEIYTRDDPYSEHSDSITPKEVIVAVIKNNLRPQLLLDTPVRIRQILEIAWTDNVASRPSFDQIIKMLKYCNSTRNTIIDSVMQSMEEYTEHLENRIEEKNSELIVATHKIDNAMSSLIPHQFISCVSKSDNDTNATTYDALGIISFEFEMNECSVAEFSAAEQVSNLTDLYSTFDRVLNRYSLFKYAITGSGCTVVLGLSDQNLTADKIGFHTAHLCLDIVYEYNVARHRKNSIRPKLKIGAHIGSAAVGVIGTVVPRFVIFGPLVDVANALARSANLNHIHITHTMWKTIKVPHIFTSERSGSLTVKGASYKTYWLIGSTESLYKDVSSDSYTGYGRGRKIEYKKADVLTTENETKPVTECTKPIIFHKRREYRNRQLNRKKTLYSRNARVHPEMFELQTDIHFWLDK